MDKIQYIERSLRCFWSSLMGLIPILGLPFAIHSIYQVFRLRHATGPWNPARQYQSWSVTLSCLGILLSIVLCFVMAGIIADRLSHDFN